MQNQKCDLQRCVNNLHGNKCRLGTCVVTGHTIPYVLLIASRAFDKNVNPAKTLAEWAVSNPQSGEDTYEKESVILKEEYRNVFLEKYKQLKIKQKQNSSS